MPEAFLDEETQNRNEFMCLFSPQAIGLPSNRRCDNCPGPARTPQIHQRRCQFELFIQATTAQVGKSEVITGDPKTLLSSGSSSSTNAEQHVTENVATKSDEIQDDSLDESSPPSDRRPVSPTTDRSVTDPHSEVIGRKRKADDSARSASRSEFLADPQGEELVRSPKRLSPSASIVQGLHSLSISLDDEHPGRDMSLDTAALDAAPISSNQPEGLLPRTRLSGDQLDGRSDVRDFLRNKAQRMFQDHPHDELTPMARHTNASGNVTLRSLFNNPTIMQEGDDSPALVSSFRIGIPVIRMLDARQGVFSGIDGVCGADENDLMDAEEIVGPSEEELLNE